MKKFQITCKQCGALYWCSTCGSVWFVKSSSGFTLCRSCWTAGTSGLNINHDWNKHPVVSCDECGKRFYDEIGLDNHKIMEHNV
jgi:hypothetical protein